MLNVAFINGAFVPLAEAKVSIEDRGFQFGDGVYEVIRTYKGRPFSLDAHLARLDRSAAALDLKQPYSRAEWTHYVLEGIKRAAYPEAKSIFRSPGVLLPVITPIRMMRRRRSS